MLMICSNQHHENDISQILKYTYIFICNCLKTLASVSIFLAHYTSISLFAIIWNHGTKSKCFVFLFYPISVHTTTPNSLSLVNKCSKFSSIDMRINSTWNSVQITQLGHFAVATCHFLALPPWRTSCQEIVLLGVISESLFVYETKLM